MGGRQIAGSADCSIGSKSHFQIVLGPRTAGGERKRAQPILSDTGRWGRTALGAMWDHPPLGLGWSVTTQDPSSTPSGLTQYLCHPPRMAVSPPTAWLQSDYSQSAKRLQPPPMPRPMAPPPQASSSPFSLSSLFSFLQAP